MTDLQAYFENNTGNCINKWMHYFDIYDFWFRKYRNEPVVILEIGIYQGGSLEMWRNYFGEKAQIFAIDINPQCKQFETERTKVFIGSQEDKEFLRSVQKQIPQVDILIDDGGHTMNQQIVSFESFFEHIKDDGIYLCEDTHTSYWNNYGGGYKRKGTFIEYSKNLIDRINAWHSREKNLKVDSITKKVDSIHFYDSIVVINKKRKKPPLSRMSGKFMIPPENFPIPASEKKFWRQVIKKALRKLNMVDS